MKVSKVSLQSPNFSIELVNSLKETGFAVITNHHIYQGLMDEVYNDWRSFFAQPTEEKMKRLYSKETHGGYFPMKSEKAKGAKVADIKEFYHWYAHLEDETRATPTAWLRFDLLSVAMDVLRAIESEMRARGVQMKSTESLSSMVEGSQQTLFRILHYPPVENFADDWEGGAIRAEAHEDINLITLLPAATNPGLQVKTLTGKWINVKADPGSIIVNVGDMLEEATGGYLKSTTHRVVVDEAAVTESRYSMPLFLHPRPEVRLSDRYTASEYLTERLKELGLL